MKKEEYKKTEFVSSLLLKWGNECKLQHFGSQASLKLIKWSKGDVWLVMTNCMAFYVRELPDCSPWCGYTGTVSDLFPLLLHLLEPSFLFLAERPTFKDMLPQVFNDELKGRRWYRADSVFLIPLHHRKFFGVAISMEIRKRVNVLSSLWKRVFSESRQLWSYWNP